MWYLDRIWAKIPSPRNGGKRKKKKFRPNPNNNNKRITNSSWPNITNCCHYPSILWGLAQTEQCVCVFSGKKQRFCIHHNDFHTSSFFASWKSLSSLKFFRHGNRPKLWTFIYFYYMLWLQSRLLTITIHTPMSQKRHMGTAFITVQNLGPEK